LPSTHAQFDQSAILASCPLGIRLQLATAEQSLTTLPQVGRRFQRLALAGWITRSLRDRLGIDHDVAQAALRTQPFGFGYYPRPTSDGLGMAPVAAPATIDLGGFRPVYVPAAAVSLWSRGSVLSSAAAPSTAAVATSQISGAILTRADLVGAHFERANPSDALLDMGNPRRLPK
jgi:hypothetical protein